METIADEYDSPWKEAIEQYFPEFIGFYFPDAYLEIDWNTEHVFLDQELKAVVQDAELGKRFVDKLVRVQLRHGGENWIYIHIEVQGTRQTGFAERMFVYNYRLYDRYRRPVASMVVLADEHRRWKPDSFGFSVLGCSCHLAFPVAKLADYSEKVEQLLVMDNVFALITAAHIMTRQTRKQTEQRYEAKLRLVRILYQQRWDKQRIINLFSVVDWLMTLPAVLEQQLWQEIVTIEERANMQYITSVERIGIAKGRIEGRQEGIIEGRQEEAARLFLLLLDAKFDGVGQEIKEKIHHASPEEIENWTKQIFHAETPESILNG